MGRGVRVSGAVRARWRVVLGAIWLECRGARGRLAFFTACLAIGVAAVVGVSALVAAMDSGIRSQSRSLLAGDLRVSARRELPQQLEPFFATRAHELARVLELSAMASSASTGESRLVELKVVEGGYPFYGSLGLDPPSPPAAQLAADEVYVGPELLAGLGLAIGERLSLGGHEYVVRASVLDEPDRLDFSLTLGPRVFLSAAGLERSALLGAKSRVRYTQLYALDGDQTRDELRELSRELRDELPDAGWLSIRTHGDAQRNVQRSLGRVEEYLGLVALLSLLLGGIGISQVVRAWLAGRARHVAVLRCLGLRAPEIARLYLGNVALLALVGCVVGGALGAGLPFLVREVAPELFEGGLEHLWQAGALARGVGLGLVVSLLFSLPPLTAVWRVPPAAVLRAEAAPLSPPRVVSLGALIALVVGVLASARVQAGEWDVALWFTGGVFALAAALWLGARGAMLLAARVPHGRLGPYLEHGLASLARPGAGTAGAVVALGLGVMVVLAMGLVERELDRTLREALPEDAPSVFLIDIQPEQWDAVHGALDDNGADSVDGVPVVMARLAGLDGRSVQEILEERRSRGRGRRGSWAYTRELRLTWMDELPEDNVVVEGALWSDPDAFEISLEEGYADDLDLELGDTLELDVQGIRVEFTLTSIRTVDWASFGINFFLIVEPGSLEGAPHHWLAAARLEPEAAEYALQNELSLAHPNVTMLRIRPILEKVAEVLARLAFGVRALGAFTVLTGLVILSGAVGATALRRAREAALLKSLGVTRAGVVRLFAVEYALSGLVAGTIGAVGALALAWGFLVHLLELQPRLPLEAIPLGAVGGALLALFAGLAASGRALRATPLETLRG